MTLSGEEIVRNAVVITARKADYLKALFRGVLTHEAAFLPKERRSIHAGLIHAVAGLDPGLFVTSEEVRVERFNPGTKLEDLDREALARALESALPFS